MDLVNFGLCLSSSQEDIFPNICIYITRQNVSFSFSLKPPKFKKSDPFLDDNLDSRALIFLSDHWALPWRKKSDASRRARFSWETCSHFLSLSVKFFKKKKKDKNEVLENRGSMLDSCLTLPTLNGTLKSFYPIVPLYSYGSPPKIPPAIPVSSFPLPKTSKFDFSQVFFIVRIIAIIYGEETSLRMIQVKPTQFCFASLFSALVFVVFVFPLWWFCIVWISCVT